MEAEQAGAVLTRWREGPGLTVEGILHAVGMGEVFY